VVHLGQLEAHDVDEVLAPYLRACDALLVETEGAERKSFWEDFLEFVDSRLSESAKEAEGRAQGALAAARLAFKQRYDGLEEAARNAALTSIEGTHDPSKYFDQLIECPACRRLAVANGSIKTDWAADWEVEGGEAYAVGAYPVVTFSPDRLECRVCGLELAGEELIAVGIDNSWQLDQDEVDASDFEEPWQEPDWGDWGR
jgi:hypothetical protein